MSFSSTFRSRMNYKGNSKYERAMKRKERSFEEWFHNSLTRHDILVDGAPYPAVIQDQNQANNKGLSDDKYLIVENTTPSEVGSILDWSEKKWIVFSNEYKTIKTHKQQIIKMCNHYIKWTMSDGEISGDGKGHVAYVQNNTLYTLGVSMSGNNAWMVNAKMSMYLPYSEEAKNIKIGQRIFIGENIYEIMLKDFVSRDGLIYYLMEENFYNAETDDFENRIADRWKENDIQGVESGKENNVDNNKVNEDKFILSLSGSNTVKIGKTITITATMLNEENGEAKENPIADWVVNDVDSIVSVESKDQNAIVIRVPNNFSYVGKQVTIIGLAEDGTSSSKTVNIISPY